MKRIGLLTISCIPNYGALLQSYATYTIFNQIINEEHGGKLRFDVINYEPMQHKKRYSVRANVEDIVHCKKFKTIARDFIRLISLKHSEDYEMHEKCIPFQNRFKLYENSMDDLSMYDAFITGSDQTWNPFMMNEISLYLLPFADGKYRASYAASFGIDKFPEEARTTYVDCLSKFQKISVRELSGLNILKSLLPGKDNYIQVLDPTLLLSKDKWEKIEDKAVASDTPYELVYMAKPSEQLLDFARKHAKRNGRLLTVISTPNTIKKINCPEYIGTKTPEEFVALVHHADFVLTNSFHGIAFSLIFHRQFYVMLNSAAVSKTNTRIESILQLTDLTDRVVDIEMAEVEPIDYNKVDSTLEKHRERSIQYIKDVLNDIDKDNWQ